MKGNNASSKKKSLRGLIIVLVVVIVLVGALVGLTYLGTKAAGDLLTQNLAEPLDKATSANVRIDPGDGNLTIDGAVNDANLLAGGTLQYYEKLGVPDATVSKSNSHATFTVKAKGGQQWLQLPWADCNNASIWMIHLNPSIPLDITLLTGGGNIKLDLTGLTVTHLSAETGGGNMEIRLPDNPASLDVSVKTGAGEVTVILRSGIAARVKVAQGNAIVSSALVKIDDSTYETAGYQNAADKVEITAGSGLGNVNIKFE